MYKTLRSAYAQIVNHIQFDVPQAMMNESRVSPSMGHRRKHAQWDLIRSWAIDLHTAYLDCYIMATLQRSICNREDGLR